MACFFRCFGLRSADRRHVVSSSDSPITTPVEPVASMNQKASSLFPSEERDGHLDRAELDDWELRDETPDEIRKLPKKLKDSVGEDSEYKYHSWLPSISNSSLLENYNLSGQLPASVKFDEENTTEPAAMDSPTPCRITNEQSDLRISISSLEDVSDNSAATTNPEINGTPDGTNMSVSPAPAACKSEFLNRSVRFASESYPSENSPRTCIQHREKKEHGSIIKDSPYPTPLHLAHDMQTPGTVYASGNSARVRAQYVYTTMNSSEITDHSSISQGASLGSTQHANCNSDMSLSGSSIKGDVTVGTDLCSGIKTPALDGAGNERKYKPGGNHGDRPILGLVAEHWKEEDVSQISPKEWDGNGIPNTTTKYKEDQKVHWHATPFEERLEKALSEETFIPRRKPAIMEAVVFEDDEESDTATCNLQSLKSSKPLASY